MQKPPPFQFCQGTVPSITEGPWREGETSWMEMMGNYNQPIVTGQGRPR